MTKQTTAPEQARNSVAQYRKKIMVILAKSGRTPVRDAELAAQCRTKKGNTANYQAALAELMQEGKIFHRRRGFLSCDALHYFVGSITRLSRTFGFARRADNEEEIFIPGKFLCGAMPQDVVLLHYIPSRSGKPEGEVIDVLQAADSKLTGTVLMQEGSLMLLPDTMAKTPIRLKENPDVSYREGDKVLAELVSRGTRHAEHRAMVRHVFGNAQQASVCAKAMLTLRGITPEFPEAVLQQAQQLAETPIASEEYQNRLDLRQTPIFTIDSASSKDLDDAVSISRTANGYQLGVHIADVSHYVRPKSPLDEEALNRGTSIYYADQVVPMLPKSLSNGICSLNPQEDRLTFSALMELNQQGELVSYTFRKSIIRSAVKGVYSEVNAILDGSASPELLEKYQAVLHMIPVMNELCDIRMAQRKRRGAPEIETTESALLFNENGICVDVVPRTRGKSECIIEEMMLLANEAAAKLAREKGLPFVYRIHETPSPEKIDNLEHVLLRMGLEVPNFTAVKPGHLAKILEQAKGSPAYPVVNIMVLRSMAKAAYAPEPIGHFGLALKDYAHFTSPIRRYPDLAIHRILSAWCAGRSAEAIEKRYGAFAGQASQRSSDTELQAIMVERDCEDCYKAEYMAQHLGEEFDGIVSGISDFGFYVALPNSVEGMVHVSMLPEGEWFNDDGIAFALQYGDLRYQLGDPVRVQCVKADVNSGNVDFQLAEQLQESANPKAKI